MNWLSRLTRPTVKKAATQKEIPNEIDFNNTVSVLLPLFVPGLVLILFIYFIFRLLKKIF